ncbi:MAG: cytochrome P450 [Pseudonocardiaceae bacterium]
MTAATEQHVPYLDITRPGFDFTGAEIAAAREAHWYAHTPLGVLILRHADVHHLLRDRRFDQDGRGYLALLGLTEGDVHEWFVSLMVNRRGADHTRLRAPLNAAFAPAAVERRAEVIDATVARLLDGMLSGEDDFVRGFADPLPVAVMCDLLGVPAADAGIFARWTTDLGLVFTISTYPDALDRVRTALAGLRGYVADLIAGQRDERVDDVISLLLAAQRAGHPITDQDIEDLVVGLLFAGHDTTRNQFGQAMVTWCEHPAQWDRLGGHPDLAPSAVDEVLRWRTAVPTAFRFAYEPVDYQGLHIPTGTFVMLCLQSAHHDPRVFAAPERFDIARTTGPLLQTFGAGPHYCLGTALARAEFIRAFRALATACAPPVPAGPVEWRSTFGICGPESLPVRLVRR